MGRQRRYRSDAEKAKAYRRRKKQVAYFRAGSCNWETPRELFAKLDAKFHFTLDACASAENTKCANYFTREQDGLKQDWRGVVWCNPPYGLPIRDWIRKAYESSLAGTTVVLLLPARTDTEWFHEYVIPFAAEVRFLRGRLKFVNATSSAPFASCIVIFRPKGNPDEKNKARTEPTIQLTSQLDSRRTKSIH